jgi:hypothetical protein
VDLRALLLDENNGWAADTLVTFPDDGDYWLNATQRWTAFSAPTYFGAVTPATEEDVVAAMLLARDNGIPFMATGGRHGYMPGFGALQNGLAIDLTLFDSVNVDPEAATLTIGGGVTAEMITPVVGAAGFEVPLGGCPCPGYVGVTIGGGINNWMGIHGLIIDALLSVRMIVASGEIVEASNEVNPDLFWAIRGAGGNFGIIVEATYHMYPPSNNDEMLVVEAAFPPMVNESYYEALARVTADQDPRLSLNSIVTWEPESESPMIMGNYHFFGPADEGMALLEPIMAVPSVMNNSFVMPWADFHHMTLFGRAAEDCTRGYQRDPYGVLSMNVDVPTLIRGFSTMSQLYIAEPDARASAWVFHSFGNAAVNQVPDEETAYAWRDATHYTYPLVRWTEGNEASQAAAQAAGDAIRQDIALTSGYDQLISYINFAHGDESLEQIFGERKLPRLAATKAQWDPENLFQFNFPIPTSYP